MVARERGSPYDPAVDLVGKQIGSYVVEKELGAGGTGTVYLCKHTMIDRNVAVKVLHDEHARDPDQVSRFFQEAKAAAEIGHPNIIIIIDFGSLKLDGDFERSYLMMEALDGQSLDKRLRKGPGLGLEDITHVMMQTCSALVASHAKGIIHRDLKPANVFLCNRSFDPLFVKVLDFGTAKLTTPDPSVRKTQVGMVIGTPAYMSPEQCEGKGAMDHRSDVYSLGCMLYELLTGTLPFQGEIGDMLRGHLFMDIEPPSRRNPSIPPEWEALVMHMVEKSKERRPQSIVEVQHALEDLRRHAFAYQQATASRAARGKSGHTQILRSDDGSTAAGDAAVARPTLHAELAAVLDTSAPVSSYSAYTNDTPPTSGSYPSPPVMPPVTPPDERPVAPVMPWDAAPPGEACERLVHEARNANFLATLLVRPPGRWSAVEELCETSGTAAPPGLPLPPLFVTWNDHPYLDPSLCVATFVSLRDGFSASFLCTRRRF